MVWVWSTIYIRFTLILIRHSIHSIRVLGQYISVWVCKKFIFKCKLKNFEKKEKSEKYNVKKSEELIGNTCWKDWLICLCRKMFRFDEYYNYRISLGLKGIFAFLTYRKLWFLLLVRAVLWVSFGLGLAFLSYVLIDSLGAVLADRLLDHT